MPKVGSLPAKTGHDIAQKKKHRECDQFKHLEESQTSALKTEVPSTTCILCSPSEVQSRTTSLPLSPIVGSEQSPIIRKETTPSWGRDQPNGMASIGLQVMCLASSPLSLHAEFPRSRMLDSYWLIIDTSTPTGSFAGRKIRPYLVSSYPNPNPCSPASSMRRNG